MKVGSKYSKYFYFFRTLSGIWKLLFRLKIFIKVPSVSIHLTRTEHIELQEEGPIYNICYNGVNGLCLSFPAVPSAMPVPVQPVPDLFFHSTSTSIGNNFISGVF